MRDQERSSIKLFCNLYWQYLNTSFLDLKRNLEVAKKMDRSRLNEVENVRLGDFIALAEAVLKFYKDSDKKKPR